MSKKDRNLKKIAKWRSLTKLRSLKEGWDGEQAMPVPSYILDIAEYALTKLGKQPDVFLTRRQTIQMEIDLPEERYVEAEFFDEHVTVFMELQGIESEKDFCYKQSHWFNEAYTYILKHVRAASECE